MQPINQPINQLTVQSGYTGSEITGPQWPPIIVCQG